MKNAKIVRNNIKKRREEMGLSQMQLAQKIGYSSRSAICKIENGVNDLNLSKIVTIARALKTTPSYLMGWMEEKTPSDLENDTIARYLSAPEDVKRIIEKILSEP